MHQDHTKLTTTLFYQLYKYFSFAGHFSSVVVEFHVFFQIMVYKTYVFGCNLTKYLCYRVHPYDCTRNSLKRKKIINVSYNDLERLISVCNLKK